MENDANIISPSLHHLLRASDIEVDVECTDWKDAIRRSAEQLVDQGYIEDRYVDAMIESVNEYGPYIVLSPGFAMPHAESGRRKYSSWNAFDPFEESGAVWSRRT